MMIFSIIIVIILILVYTDSSGSRIKTNFYKQENNATKLLDRRFAKGEISEEEYLRRKSILKER